MTVITGEGGSGGALAIAVGNVVLALENAVYSVISPEGCASILWRTSEKAADAALAMKMTAAEQAALGVVDRVITEPGDGAHTDVPRRPSGSGRRSSPSSTRWPALSADELVAQRWRRYRDYGAFIDEGAAGVRRPGRSGRAASPVGSARRSTRSAARSAGGDAIPATAGGTAATARRPARRSDA